MILNFSPRDPKTIEKISREILSGLETRTPRMQELFNENRPYLRDL